MSKPTNKLTCVICGKEYFVYPYRVNTSKCCSRKCSHIFKIGKRPSIATEFKKGEHRSPNTEYKKGRVGMRGDKAPNWKGGTTKVRKLDQHTERYKNWRKSVFERDDYTCVHCGARGGRLEADHIHMLSMNPWMRYDIDNGQTLCKGCHIEKTREDLKNNRIFLKAINNLIELGKVESRVVYVDGYKCYQYRICKKR